MSRIILFTLIIFGSPAMAQPVVQEFTANNFTWDQSTSGLMFYDQIAGRQGLEIPIGSNNHVIFTHALWIAGLDSESEIRSSFARFCVEPELETCENLTGPLNDNLPNPPVIAEDYKHIWFVTQEEISTHTSYFNCLNSPGCDLNLEFPDGYEIPSDFLDWPAHGDTDLGYSSYLAPFFDHNGDGIYNPENGDHPLICGDFSSYIIRNDIGTTETEAQYPKMGVEIHTQIYGYNSEIPSIYNSLFVQHKIINRSEETFEDVYLGTFTDFDLGNPVDDRIGTDVQRSMYFAYNGLLFDGGSQSGPGYGSDLPALGVKILGGPFADSNGEDQPSQYPDFDTYANESSGWGDGLPNNERLGLYASMRHNWSTGIPAMELPTLPIHYYNYMRGLWLDGVPQIIGGNGYPSSDTSEIFVSRYLYYGNSDPLLVATNEIDPNYEYDGGWTEENENIPPGDRWMIGSSGPFTFEPGEVQYYDYAIIFAQQSFDAEEDVVETLKRFADEIVGMECGQLPQIVVSDGLPDQQVLRANLYPNPAHTFTTIGLSNTFSKISIDIIDMNGRIIQQFNGANRSSMQLNLDMVPGIYLVKIKADNNITTNRLVKL